MHRTLALFVLAATAGCDDPLFGAADTCPPLHMAEGGECTLDESAVAALMKSFDDGQLEKVNTEPFEQVTGGAIRNVWINRLPVADGLDTVDLYRMVDPYDAGEELPSAFPVGTVIVHERVDRTEGSTIQVRRADTYTGAADGPWWFGKYFEDGQPDENECNPCVMCHNATQHPGTEGLFGVPPEAWVDHD